MVERRIYADPDSVLDDNKSPVLIVAFHGFAQKPQNARREYFNFADMTQLRPWCRKNRVSLAMPSSPKVGWSEKTDGFAAQAVLEAVKLTDAKRWFVYGFSDGGDQALRAGLPTHGVVCHSGNGSPAAEDAARIIARRAPLVLVLTKRDRTPTNERMRRLHRRVPESALVEMPRLGRLRVNHYWTPDTNDVVWAILGAHAK